MKLQNDFLDALLKEMLIRNNYLEDEKVNTIYFGGGTPSLLNQDQLRRIMAALHRNFTVSSNAEITFEANPDDIQPENLSSWRKNGINRLSIGIQSFYEEDLVWMNRAHNATQALACIPAAQNAGFNNMSIDLIYGTPTLPDEHWKKNLERATQSGVTHLSCYALTVEPRTALDAMIRKNKVAQVNNDDQARQFLLMTDYLQASGYEHYEISNFAKPGKRSLHNSSYWGGDKYLGLGPSAHSFNGISRQWNIANNALYIQSLKDNTVPFESEVLNHEQRLNEYIMTSLRTLEGMDLEHIKNAFGVKYRDAIEKESVASIQMGRMRNIEGRLVLTRDGMLFADGIASGMFIIG